MSRRLAFADWLAGNGHKERASWIRLCCGDCQYAHDLRTGFTLVERSPVSHNGFDPLRRPAKAFEAIRPDWWRTAPEPTGYQRCHFGRIVVGELGDPRWIYEGDWLKKAWREGWLELLSFEPADEERLDGIADAREECRSVPFILDTTRTACGRAPEEAYRRILGFAGLHGLVFSPSELALTALRDFADHAQDLRYLRLSSLQKGGRSIRALEQLPHLAQLRSLQIGTSYPDDDSMRFVTATRRVEFLGLYGKRLTDRGLERIPDMPSLRYLAIDVPGVSREAIERLRRECPRLTIHVERDMRSRIGPA